MVFEIVGWAQCALENLGIRSELREASDLVLDLAPDTVRVIALSLHVKPVVWASESNEVPHRVLDIARLNYVSSN